MQLRRDDVVVEDPVVEIDTPFPLRTLESDSVEIAVIDPKAAAPKRAGKPIGTRIGEGIRGLFILALLAIYPTLIVLSSDVGDRDTANLVDRTEWTSPWAGGSVNLIERHYSELGWASDAPDWAPMGLLTAKPAFQSALSESMGEYVSLVARQASAAGRPEADLEAAARLLHAGSTGIQLRAARDALVSYDGRMRRRSTDQVVAPFETKARLGLIDLWATRSQGELVQSASMISGAPIDENATVAVYAAKGRAQAAFLFLETMDWPDDSKALAARNAALDAWKAAAEFHPVIVFNGSPDGSLFGNHASSMGFLVSQAKSATQDYAEFFDEKADSRLAALSATTTAISAVRAE